MTDKTHVTFDYITEGTSKPSLNPLDVLNNPNTKVFCGHHTNETTKKRTNLGREHGGGLSNSQQNNLKNEIKNGGWTAKVSSADQVYIPSLPVKPFIQGRLVMEHPEGTSDNVNSLKQKLGGF